MELKRDHTYAVHWRNERGQSEHSTAKRTLSDTSLSNVQFLPPDYLPFNEPVLNAAPPSIKAIIAESLAVHDAKEEHEDRPWVEAMRAFLKSNSSDLRHIGAVKRRVKLTPMMVRRLCRKLGSASMLGKNVKRFMFVAPRECARLLAYVMWH